MNQESVDYKVGKGLNSLRRGYQMVSRLLVKIQWRFRALLEPGPESTL